LKEIYFFYLSFLPRFSILTKLVYCVFYGNRFLGNHLRSICHFCLVFLFDSFFFTWRWPKQVVLVTRGRQNWLIFMRHFPEYFENCLSLECKILTMFAPQWVATSIKYDIIRFF